MQFAISYNAKISFDPVSIMSQSVPALRACHSHQRHPGVLEDPGIQDLQQVPALLSHQKGPKHEWEKDYLSRVNEQKEGDIWEWVIVQYVAARDIKPMKSAALWPMS